MKDAIKSLDARALDKKFWSQFKFENRDAGTSLCSHIQGVS